MAASIFQPIPEEERRKNQKKAKQRMVQLKKEMFIPLLDDNRELSPREYLRQNAIDLESVLRQPVLYYPGAGSDFGPLELFARHSAISTVVYCDYSYEFARRAIEENIYAELSPYEVTEIRRIMPAVLGCGSWEDFWPSSPEARRSGNPSNAFGLYAEMRLKPEKKTIHFIYLCTEAIQTYKILFSDRKISPAVVVIQDHGLGGGWTHFGGNDSKLYEAAKPALPKFLYVHRSAWPGYKRVSDYGEGEGMHRNSRALFVRREKAKR